MGALAVLPETIELIEGGVAGQAELDQETADHRAGATDACPTVDVHATARLHGVVQAIEDLGHMHALRGQAMIFDGLAEVLDAERQLTIVAVELIRLGEVNETLDAGVDEALQSPAGCLAALARGVLSRQNLAGQHPVAVSKRSWTGWGGHAH